MTQIEVNQTEEIIINIAATTPTQAPKQYFLNGKLFLGIFVMIAMLLTFLLPSSEPVAACMKVNVFSNEKLAQFFDKIIEDGNGKLVYEALQSGLTIYSLNNLIHTQRIIKESPFEGVANRGSNFSDISSGGIYYGEHLDGLRDGFGFLYITTTAQTPFLYLYEWSKGKPLRGNWIQLSNEKWYKYEGLLDDKYLATGVGSWTTSDGQAYEGQHHQSMREGYGRYAWRDGTSHEGKWVGNYRHGFGRLTQNDGHYMEGQWESDKPIGRHKYYTRQGNMLQVRTYQDGMLIKTEQF
ncbi:hypothetical protein FGO68_gene399 [Halteria grandinella]|uniref:Toxin-antitoxin system YwqK family antitoxin n=1 Tax=Halteria grandinella TaxID=5974 RepID=A0A8J8NUM7_HALGN|nr:hypothetical protein FGO68_gene399 [Halteria grandinella]